MDTLLAEIKFLGIILIVVSVVYLTAITARDSEAVEYYPPATPESYRQATVWPDSGGSEAQPPRSRFTELVAGVEADE
jgi:hypothetical protein